jgi:hypothetical protein
MSDEFIIFGIPVIGWLVLYLGIIIIRAWNAGRVEYHERERWKDDIVTEAKAHWEGVRQDELARKPFEK